jgi:predicted fused transcriptional regulator/phosphomethylpyrimidine kinase
MDGLICQGLAQAAHALNAVFGGITTLSPGAGCNAMRQFGCSSHIAEVIGQL